MKDFDFKSFRTDVETLLKALEEKYDIKINTGAVVIREYNFTMSVCGEGKNDIMEKAKFLSKAREYGFSSRDYKRPLEISGTRYLLVGFNEDELSPCDILNTVDGKIYKADEDLVAAKFMKTIESEQKNSVDLFDM